jgi:hypothetical protein
VVQRDHHTITAQYGKTDVVQVVNKMVGELPDVSEDSIPSEAQLRAGERAGKDAHKDMTDAYGNQPEVLEFVVRDMMGDPEVSEEEAPTETQPPTIGSGLPEGGSSIGKKALSGVKSDVSGRGKKDKAMLGLLGLGVAPSGAKPVAEVLNRPLAPQGSTGGFNPMELLPRVEVAKNVMDVIPQVAAGVGAFFSTIQAVFDVRSMISSMVVYKKLDDVWKAARDKAMQSGVADVELLEAIQFAM